MISVKPFPLLLCGLLFWCGVMASGIASSQVAGRRYGPTTPGGYYVRVAPSAITLAHSQRARLTVSVEDSRGEPMEDVFVSFAPSEGTVTTDSSRARGGVVAATFIPATGGDSPRRAFIVTTVEDLDITVFIDIVPAVFGR